MNWPQFHKIRVQGKIRSLHCELNRFNYHHHLIINSAEPLILVQGYCGPEPVPACIWKKENHPGLPVSVRKNHRSAVELVYLIDQWVRNSSCQSNVFLCSFLLSSKVKLKFIIIFIY